MAKKKELQPPVLTQEQQRARGRALLAMNDTEGSGPALSKADVAKAQR